jgi:hypothetical protein
MLLQEVKEQVFKLSPTDRRRSEGYVGRSTGGEVSLSASFN